MNKAISMFKNLFNPNITMTPYIKLKDNKPEFNANISSDPLETATPESQGVDSNIILKYLQELNNDSSINMHNVLILKNGKIISKSAFGNSDLSVWKMTFSACKSVVSLAIGMLVDEGKLDINTPITQFFPEYVNPVKKIRLRDVTVKSLLTMSTGCTFNEFLCMSSDDWEGSFFKSAFSLKPGTKFSYNSLNTYMLSAIIKRVSGQTLTEYLRPRLFEPLNIKNFYFGKSNSDTEIGGWGLFITPEDFAKIGQVVLNRGVWNSQRIISEEWLNTATSAQISTPEQFGEYDYGYQFWSKKSNNSFLFNGMFGQNVLGFFDSNILIVTNAGNNELFQQSRFFDITNEYFSGKFPKRLPENMFAYFRLLKFNNAINNKKKKNFFDIIFPNRRFKSFIKNFDLLGVDLVAKSENSASVGLLPKLLQIFQNNYSSGLKSISIVSSEKQVFLKYLESKAEFFIPLGIDEFKRGELVYYGEKYLVSSKIQNNNDEITIDIDFIETFSSRRLIITKNQGGFILHQTENPGMQLIRDFTGLFKESFINKTVNRIKNDFIIGKCENIFDPKVNMIVK